MQIDNQLTSDLGDDIEYAPLSYNQRSIWLHHVLNPQSVANNVAQAIHFQNELDIAVFREALQAVTNRHAALRTTFTEVDGEPVQVVHASRPVFFQHEDASGWSEQELHKRLADETYRLFDLAEGPLFRAFLFSQSPEKHIFLFSMHHIITDLWSIAIFFKDMFHYYNEIDGTAHKKYPPLRKSYQDFTGQQLEMLNSAQGMHLQEFWQQQLSGDLPVLTLPTDQPRQKTTSHRGATYLLPLGAQLSEQLKGLADCHETTLFSQLFAAYQLLLRRYSGQDDILVGSPHANRSAQSARLMGYFVNPVILRVKEAENPPFSQFVQQVHQIVDDAFAHGAYPLQKILEDLQAVRKTSTGQGQTVFQVGFYWQKSLKIGSDLVSSGALGVAREDKEVDGFKGGIYPLQAHVSLLDLTLSLAEVNNQIMATFEYKADLFEEATIRRMAANFQTLLEQIVAAPETPIGEFSILSAEEQKLLVRWGRGRQVALPDKTVPALVSAQAAQTPQVVAVRFDDQEMTYAALDGRSNQLAHFLQQKNVGPGNLVGVMIDRSPDMVVALLGIMKAGAAYLPLDPGFPPERLAYILEDAGAECLLISDKYRSRLPALSAEVIGMDAEWKTAIEICSPTAVFTQAGPDSPAYVIYTSGSTGKPKGVQVTQRNVVNFLQAMAHKPGLAPADVLLSVTTLSFDISVLEIFLPLLVGAQVVIVGRETAVNPQQLQSALIASQATVMQATPTTWRMLLENGWTGDANLKILCGGEVMSRELAEQLLPRCQELWNMYGPTETTVWSTIHQVQPGTGSVPIGRPIDNTAALILDKAQRPLPVGVPGELYLGGAGVACGYLRRPELTGQKFRTTDDLPAQLPDGWLAAETEPLALYRTGDLVRLLPDGTLEFLGRLDHQVKVRGYRIELGEIESRLVEHPAVLETAVITQESTPGNNKLVAYFTAKTDVPTFEQLQTHLKRTLPDYMIPTKFVRLDQFPLTTSRKIDRRALAPIQGDNLVRQTAPSLPHTAEQAQIAAIWCEVLNLEHVGIHDNFFELGGHSLLATQIVSRIRDAFKIELPIQALFELATVAELAEVVQEQRSKSGAEMQLPLVAQPASANPPLSFSQERMWFLHQLNPQSTAYNIPGALRLTGPLNLAALAWSLNQVFNRHESLRTRFLAIGGEPVTFIEPDFAPELPVEDCRSLPREQREAYVMRVLEEAVRTPFKLDQLPLLVAKLFQLDEEEYVLLVNMHHIISDQWSLGVLSRDVAAYYQAYLQ
ncbi:MAG: amino acid adenylation domain-containing protein, partial [Anaerolineales bacterium]|nr:amino acid adenylation domain-containing protein [Anaerolineales bacterium]